MTDTNIERIEASPIPEIGEVTFTELWSSLKAGLHDFRRAPGFGLAFSAFYVATGLGLFWIGAGTFIWTLAFALGFPLVAPFAAVGLYEVSRRIEADEPLDRQEVLSVVWRERTRQLPWIGVILTLIFLFWSFFAHMTFAMFFGMSALTNVSTSYEIYFTTNGMAMIAMQTVVGAAVAFLVYGVAVMSLPLLVDKEIDFVTAMLISLRTVSKNKVVLGMWAVIIAGLLFVAMLPLFLGLFVALPVLGHATWHLYRRALYHPV
ncbi:MAG: DUF2189 domain-containing protein [Boseongicola sp.]|nr:DUF2189 domain-containing protein [Boseongicola sp.]NNL19125.1 DUF2189 domain-containing protein [Boseongicola sp.]